MEAAMDQPCRWHTPNPDHPSNHLTKDCSWTKFLMQKGAVKDAQAPGGPVQQQQQLPPPPPLTGANALPVQPQPNRQQYQQVNRVEQNNDQPPPPAPLGRNVYEDPHLCCVVFVTEPMDRQSVHRRSMEVNAVMPAVPKYMLWSDQEITWSFKDHPKIMPNPGGYALVVDPIMKGPETRVKFSKVLIDNGSSINIMYKHTMRTLGITENMLQPTHTTFHGIVPGLSCAPIGKVRVDVSFGGRDNCRVENIEFEVVDLDSPYHALLGRPALAAFMASTHTAYLKMKMPAPRGPLTVVGNYKVSMETASAGSNLAESLVIAEEKKRMQTAVALAQSSKLSLAAMSGNLASPAFKPTNETKDIVLDPAPRAHRSYRGSELAEHSLNVRKDAKPVRQPLRRFAEDRRKIIGEEVTKLLVAGFIVEVTHTEWLANPVMVEKKKDENLEAKLAKVWRMCIDYTNLNKACPRDPFPLPRIDQADAAFKELKNMLVTAPILASPLEREPMLLYIAATNRVVSVVVVVEREEEGKTVQRPVYYLSEVLSSSKQNYPHFQKMTYGVFMAATKLKHYFEEHPMKVVSEAPISDIMGNKDASGRIAKWAIQLSPYVPVYERRDAIKSQALADFLVDWAEIQYKPPEHKIEYWKMHFDGSKLKEGLGAGVVLTSPKGDHLRYVLQVHFRASNNVAEYEALIHGLKVAKEIGALRIICYGDSDLVVQQCSGDWDAKDANMASYRFHVQKIAGFFEGCEFHHVPRAENEAADTLSKLGSSRQEIPPGIALAHLRVPSIKPSPESESIFVPESHVVPMEIDEGNPGTTPANSGTVPVNSGTATPMPEEAMLVDSMDIDMPVFVVREAPSWVEPIKEFLINGTLPVDENESRRIQRRSKAYTIINGEVYKRSVTGVLQRCVEPEEGREMLEEIHRGECGHHASSRALVAKVFRHGFYWPTALDNAEDLVRKCNGCQRYAKQNHTPASGLKTIPLTWPFAVWCLDMVGPFKTARGNMTHILVMVDKFTKWLEVKPIAKCDGHTAVKFLKDVILRSNIDPNNVPLASLVAQEENVDVNFIKNNNFNNNAYRNNSGNNYRPYPSANGNGYGNSYGNSYNNNRSVPSGLEAMLKEFISTQTAFNKSVEEKLDKIDTIASRVDRLASDVNLLKLKVMPNNDIDNKITTTANAIQVRINENIRLMAELRARWDREENEKLAKENNVAKVWTITTTSNANSSHVAAPPTINGKIIGVGNVSTPSAKRTKLPEIAKTAETACDKTAEIFSNLGNNDPIAVAHNDLDFDDCHISEVIKFLQKLAKSPNASAINLAFTKHITNALIKAREEKLKLETSIPRKLEDGWEPIIKMKFNDFECNALCDLGASISVMPKKIYDMLDLPPLKNCYLDVNLADNVKKKPLGRIDNVHITVNNNLVPVDFVVLDIECNASCPIVLGRPFLRTVGAVIDMREGNIKYQFPLKKGMEHFPRKIMKLPFDSIIRTSYDVDASTLDVT
ncbi:hypothetical protein QYE76_010702 [Lolium multiflorum]|uniref:Uncharacterized protein n=1 Tax=Lolium multiflorum TaxID=4521 RepID=A0AAD8TXU2_LOLMU|nr:hypothetical protein QYE76_010702 [Lolium multiflorum]